MSQDPKVILYAEDSEDDVLLLQRAFAKTGLDANIVAVAHGLDAIDYLSGAGRYSDREKYPLPNLILLDIKMPRLDGLEVLKWIRRQEWLRAIPVMMLTSSSQPSDVATAYASKADCYLVKPVEVDALRALVGDLAKWCGDGEAMAINPLRIRGAVPPPRGAA